MLNDLFDWILASPLAHPVQDCKTFLSSASGRKLGMVFAYARNVPIWAKYFFYISLQIPCVLLYFGHNEFVVGNNANHLNARNYIMSTKAKKSTTKAAPVNATEPNKNRYNNGQRTYPLPAEVITLVPGSPAKGADQRLRWDEVSAAKKLCGKGKFTAEYLAANCPGGRRTLRRAQRMGAFVGWGPQGPVAS